MKSAAPVTSRVLHAVIAAGLIFFADAVVALLGVGFVTAQQNAHDAVQAQKVASQVHSHQIDRLRLEVARQRRTIDRLVSADEREERERIAAAAYEDAIDAERNTPPLTTTSTAPRRRPSTSTTTTTTTTTTTEPCAVIAGGQCLGGSP